MLIPCAHCIAGEKYDNLYAFRLHCTVQHRGLNFPCAFDNCFRLYESWPSFKKHLVHDHQVLLKPSSANSEKISQISNAQLNVRDSIDDDDDFVPEPSYDSASETLRNFIRDEVPDDLESLLKNEADILVAKLCSRATLPRSLTTSIVHDFTSFFTSGIIAKLSQLILSLLENSSVSTEEKDKIHSVFQFLANPFKHLQSDFLRKRHFEKTGHYVKPQSYTIHSRMESVKTKDGIQLRMKDVTGQFVPLREVLKRMFELPNFYETVLDYMQKLREEEDKTLSNFMQSECFKRKLAMYPSESLVLALMVYHDDFEPNNALGPHSEKLGCGYVGLPFLPPHCRSKLQNILMVLLFNADDRKLYGNKNTFKPLIEELKFLGSTGISVSRPDGAVVRIFFVIGLLFGDNLGLNGLSGYVESFSATFFCRVCKLPKTLSERIVTEEAAMLRTPQSYQRDVLLDDYHQTGIKEKCVFDDIPAFETPTDIGFDPFHDLLEGVCHYTLKPILKHFHSNNRHFLENLNDRLYFFEYCADSDNKPPTILPESLESHKIKMTGAEMATFVRLLGVIIGDLIEEGDRFWNLYLLLHDIVTICSSQRLPKNIGPTLEFLVKEHNSLYMELTNETLKPKHHFLTHYNSRTIKLMGPLALMSTIRYEGKHKTLKSVANVCCTRKNLPLTVATKEQEELCYRFASQQPLRPSFVVGPGQVADLQEFDQYPAFSLTLPEEIFTNANHQLCANWVVFNDSRYERKMSLLTGFDEAQCPKFAKIEIILICKNGPFFVCSPLTTFALDSHIRGFFVRGIPNQLNWFCLSPTTLSDPLPLSIYLTANKENVIVPKHILIV